MIFSEIYVNNKTGEALKEDEVLIQLKLADTLQKLANSSDPLKLFYEGMIAQDIIKDIKEAAQEWNRTGNLVLISNFVQFC